MPRHQMGYESDAMAAVTFAVAARASPATRPAVVGLGSTRARKRRGPMGR